MFKSAVKVLKATIGIESNRKELLPHFPFKEEVKSLLTDFHEVKKISYNDDLDGYIWVEESAKKPSFSFLTEKAEFRGSFLNCEKEASDLRFGLWGNQGFLYRYILYLLEKKHGIYNFHACALYHEKKDHLYIVIGGAGSGKTVLLLSGLAQGLKLFSTETVHLRITRKGLSWFMGSLVDNVRLGTLIHDFPQFLPNGEALKPEKLWLYKIALNLSSHKTDRAELINPGAVSIIFPRIEEGRKGFLLYPIDDKRKAVKALFDNVSQKLSETVLLYDRIPVMGFNEEKMAFIRHEYMTQLVHHKTIYQMAFILSNPNECWGDLLK